MRVSSLQNDVKNTSLSETDFVADLAFVLTASLMTLVMIGSEGGAIMPSMTTEQVFAQSIGENSTSDEGGLAFKP